MAEELKKQGLFVDESFVLRVLEPNVAKDTQDLKEENEIFLESKLNFLFCVHWNPLIDYCRARWLSQSDSRHHKPFRDVCKGSRQAKDARH